MIGVHRFHLMSLKRNGQFYYIVTSVLYGSCWLTEVHHRHRCVAFCRRRRTTRNLRNTWLSRGQLRLNEGAQGEGSERNPKNATNY